MRISTIKLTVNSNFSSIITAIAISAAIAISFSLFSGFLSVTSRGRSFSSQSLKLVADYPFKLPMVLIKLLNALRASLDQPFSKSCGFHKLEFMLLGASLPDVSFTNPFSFLGALPEGQSCSFSCRNASLNLIYRHRVKSVCKCLNSHGELSLC
jgi:hypothetical protein